MKTSDLTGSALDWAVAKCEGHEVAVAEGTGMVIIRRNNVTDYFNPSSNWSWAGPIIEKEKIVILYYGTFGPNGAWEAMIGSDTHYIDQYPGDAMPGPTPLIAAMRCYVMLELGDDVDIPEELK